MQGVPHEEEMAGPEEFVKQQLGLRVQNMMQKLQSLWDSGTEITSGSPMWVFVGLF
jgi:hypothetical protein